MSRSPFSTCSFWVAGDESAARATELVEELGFPVVEEE